jgi:AcrR family transcriptional regulator
VEAEAMARKPGDKNRDFEQKRSNILDALEERLLQPDGGFVTLNEMATVAQVSLSTLRHHVGTRADVWSAMLERYGARGAPYLQLVASPTDMALEDSLRLTLTMILAGLQRGLLPMLATGLVVGLQEPTVGPAYLNTMLEPILASLEARLGHHEARGELAPCDRRAAALFLISPLLLGALHQQGLGGCGVRPLDMGAMVEELLTRFLRAYPPQN